jgi:tetratricopeptide (TPR) repeat protein
MSFLHEQGDLARTPLAALLIEALNLRASGVLSVEHGGGTSRLYVREGALVGAQVFQGFRPLGHMLLQAGLIDVGALSQSLARMAETGRPQGEILVEMGAVTRSDVETALAEQQAGYFALVASLESGGYRFEIGAPLPAWTSGSLLPPLRTVVDALERPQAAALVVSALQPIATGGVRLSSAYAASAGGFNWTSAERALVERLSTPMALEAFFAPSEVAPERGRAMLAALLLLGLARPAGVQPGDTLPGILFDAAEPPTPTAAPGAPPAPPEKRSDPAEARARRQRLLHRAMQNMGLGPFAGRPPSARGGERAPARPSSVPTGRPPAGTAEEALRRALEDVAPRAREANLFARLGVPRTATRDEVKQAYLALAKQFHPDRFASPSLADLQDRVREFFAAVNEAYGVLSDDRRRAEYAAGLRDEGSTPRNAEAARVDFQKGEACLRTRDYARARGFYEAAVRADPRAEYQAALAWTWIVDPASRDRARARALLAEATRDASCDRAFFAAAILARDEGNDGQAERMLRAALQANPRHVDAVRELRALQSRRSLNQK